MNEQTDIYNHRVASVVKTSLIHISMNLNIDEYIWNKNKQTTLSQLAVIKTNPFQSSSN